MPAQSFFREPSLPSQDRRAYERFLIDTHLERKAEARERAPLFTRLRALVRFRAPA